MKHDPDDLDNCPPKCRECNKITRNEHRGGRSTVINSVCAVKPGWWACDLACGHFVEIQRSGQHPPTSVYCPMCTCPGVVVPGAKVKAVLSEAQARIVEQIRVGRLHTAMTGTRDGNIVKTLISKDVLFATNMTFVRGDATYHGRSILHAVVYSGLKIAK